MAIYSESLPRVALGYSTVMALARQHVWSGVAVHSLFTVRLCDNWAATRGNLWFANNTGADQPAHSRSLISAFVIRILESIICKPATDEVSIF